MDNINLHIDPLPNGPERPSGRKEPPPRPSLAPKLLSIALSRLPRILKVALVAFGVSCSLRSLLNVVGLLISMLRGRRRDPSSQPLLSLIDFRFGFFFSSLSAIWKLIHLLLALRDAAREHAKPSPSSSPSSPSPSLSSPVQGEREEEEEEEAKNEANEEDWRWLWAGLASGLAIYMVPKGDRPTYALYTATHVGEVCARAFLGPKVPPQHRWLFDHMDTLLMCISASQILYCYVAIPHTLSPSYNRFLVKFGQKDPLVLKTILHVYTRNPAAIDTDSVVAFCAKHGAKDASKIFVGPPDVVDICKVLHPNEECVPHFFRFLARTFLASMALYTPLHLVLQLLSLRRRLARAALALAAAAADDEASSSSSSSSSPRRPPPHWTKEAWRYLKGVACSTVASSAFLSLYCALSWGSLCVMWRMGNRNLPLARMAMAVAGLPTALEFKPRRMELALYCLPRAIECLYNESKMEWKMPLPHLVDVSPIIFCLSLAALAACFKKHPEGIKPSFRFVIDYLWGEEEPEETGSAAVKKSHP